MAVSGSKGQLEGNVLIRRCDYERCTTAFNGCRPISNLSRLLAPISSWVFARLIRFKDASSQSAGSSLCSVRLQNVGKLLHSLSFLQNSVVNNKNETKSSSNAAPHYIWIFQLRLISIIPEQIRGHICRFGGFFCACVSEEAWLSRSSSTSKNQWAAARKTNVDVCLFAVEQLF